MSDAPIQVGISVIWQWLDEYDALPIVNLPPNTQKVKIRVRPQECPIAYIKTSDGIREFHIQKSDDGLRLIAERARNIRRHIAEGATASPAPDNESAIR